MVGCFTLIFLHLVYVRLNFYKEKDLEPPGHARRRLSSAPLTVIHNCFEPINPLPRTRITFDQPRSGPSTVRSISGYPSSHYLKEVAVYEPL